MFQTRALRLLSTSLLADMSAAESQSSAPAFRRSFGSRARRQPFGRAQDTCSHLKYNIHLLSGSRLSAISHRRAAKPHEAKLKQGSACTSSALQTWVLADTLLERANEIRHLFSSNFHQTISQLLVSSGFVSIVCFSHSSDHKRRRSRIKTSSSILPLSHCQQHRMRSTQKRKMTRLYANLPRQLFFQWTQLRVHSYAMTKTKEMSWMAWKIHKWTVATFSSKKNAKTVLKL